jgi:ribosomal protein L7/L12
MVVTQVVDRNSLIPSIRATREVTGLGLADATRIMDKVPSVVSESVSQA